MKKQFLLMALLVVFLSCTLFNFTRVSFAENDREWQTIYEGWFTGGNWSGTYYNRSIMPMYPPLNITIEEKNGRTFDIEWMSNCTGEWNIFNYNLSCENGTYQQIAEWANESKKTYWWKLRANSSFEYWESNIFKFTTMTYSYTSWSDTWVFYFKPKEIKIRSFKPIDFEGKGMSFAFWFDLIMDDYNDSIELNISTRDPDITITPENNIDRDGVYIVDDLKLLTLGNKNDYPFDTYSVEVVFLLKDDKPLNTSDYKPEVYNEDKWKMDTKWHNNNLKIQFSRTQEIAVYWILFISAILSIAYSVIYMFISENKVIERIGGILSGGVFFGNFLAFFINNPVFSSPYIWVLIILLIVSLISGILAFVIRKKLKW